MEGARSRIFGTEREADLGRSPRRDGRRLRNSNQVFLRPRLYRGNSKPRAITARARNLRHIDQPDSPPAEAEQPRPSPGDGRRFARPLEVQARPLPSIEPPPRRSRIHPRHPPVQRDTPLRRMPPRVQEHVRNRPPHLARRSQHVQVKPIPQHGPPAPPHPKHLLYRPRQPHTDRLHSAPEIEPARKPRRSNATRQTATPASRLTAYPKVSMALIRRSML
jgi:hypothetical protein